MTPPSPDTIILQETLLSRLIHKKKEKLFLALTKASPPLFLRASDIISATPQVTGAYEVRIKNLLSTFASTGYGDFLLDIGANIGLISCQSGNLFKEVHCFEPNMDCFNILTVNTKISLDQCSVTLHPYGLGDKNHTVIMKVPRHNWGGGFIVDENNSYSEQELAKKEGKQQINHADFIDQHIEIRKTEEILGALFLAMKAKNHLCGIIKIDVEGYEATILKSIARVIPPALSCLILFESLGNSVLLSEIAEPFGQRATLYQLARFPDKSSNRMVRLFKTLVQNGYQYRLVPYTGSKKSSDMVLMVDSQS